MDREDVINEENDGRLVYTIADAANLVAAAVAAERYRACLIIKEYLIVKDYCDGDVQNAIDDIMNDDVVVLKGGE